LSELYFAEPQWVHAMWGVAATFVLLYWLDRRGGRALSHFVSEPMRARLVRLPSGLRRRLHLAGVVVAMAASVLALMRPQWGVEFVMAPQVGAEIMIALDVSRSMLAEDVAPNRLERAKAEIRDLLPYLEGDQVGLIVFAGRASVQCPLTPDFGFLRLVLDGVDPTSVSRGGTRLEEPIRKATAGFGASGDLARVILLITDGEDHDSFPADAAREAAERGIRILAIGFGDEAGSEIWLSDKQTGARARLVDADGRPVVSRLDGDLLRELAMLTEGAYVPAGTGVLDLASIFDAHIRPLMRGTGEERGRTVQKDGFQWAILVALAALVGGALAHGSRGASIGLLLIAWLAAPPAAHAQTPAASVAHDEVSADLPPADPLVVETSESGGRSRLEVPEDPREAFNRGLVALETDALDDAVQLFEAARGGARGDAEVRFRATFDLAWVDVKTAEQNLEADPQAALASLGRAADWFREAVALRPESDDARRNLEIVLQRALLLADSIAEREPRDVEARLEALIEAQRAATTATRGAIEEMERRDDPGAADAMRPHFRRLAVQQRQILADTGALAEVAGRELDGLRDLAEAEHTPEQQMRAAQLEGVLHSVHRARERMGQARSQLRRGQAGRAHRRSAAALSNLKRAREQLQDPVQLLDGLIRDSAQMATETRALAASLLGIGPAADRSATRASIPSWLDTRYLGEGQRQLADRTLELHTRLSAGLGGLETATDPDQLALAEQIRAAEPLVDAAGGALAQATDTLEADDASGAVDAQARGLTALVEAREHFLDLKGLIEAAWADQGRIEGALGPQIDVDDATLAEYAPALHELQSRNLDRVRRMAPMVEKLRSDLETQPGEGGAATSEEQRSQAAQRLELADGLLAMTESAMRGAIDAFAATMAMEKNAGPTLEAGTRVATAKRGLDSLRRLFFSVVEHIRDAAQRQIELGDETEAAAGRQPNARATAFAPVAHRQHELADGTEALASALHEQALTDPAAVLGQQGADSAAADDAAADKLVRASELVLVASDEMGAAAEGLDAGSPDPDAIREQQSSAVQKLGEALEILQPPQQDPSQQEASSDQQEQSEQESGPQTPEGEDESEAQPSADPSQMLQAVRDREAERHRNQRDRVHRGYEPVEKDW
jgi:Ca-activated chloride channel family protein